MALDMRAKCERCGSELSLSDEAYICSYECTFCKNCSKEMKKVSVRIAAGNWCVARGGKSENDKSKGMNPQGIEPCGSLHGSVRQPIRR
jgi:hypothetical protein